MLVLPPPVVSAALQRTETSDLVTTDVGYFPSAEWHDVNRPAGAAQMIVIYCVAGRGWVHLNGTQHEVGPGLALTIAPQQPHRYGSLTSEPWTIYWLHAAGRKVPALYQLLTDDAARPVFSIGDDSEIVSLFDEIYQTLNESYGPERLLLAGLWAGRLLGRLINLRHREQPEILSSRQRILQTIASMQQRPIARITVAELARQANLSRSHYASVFKQQTGYPVLDFFIRQKMKRAAHLLDTTDLAIKAIAADLGFRDALYFSRRFHKVYKMSPKSYKLTKKG
jgi:AraC-like DNA-binding protein